MMSVTVWQLLIVRGWQEKKEHPIYHAVDPQSDNMAEVCVSVGG